MSTMPLLGSVLISSGFKQAARAKAITADKTTTLTAVILFI
jgi:hypothetical protein